MSFIPLCRRASFALLLLTFAAGLSVQAQTENDASAPSAEASRPRRVHAAAGHDGTPRLENDLVVIAPPPDPLVKQKLTLPFVEPLSLRFKQLLTSQITERLGAPYVYGAAGPYYFDCSGFVWSVYQASGVPFERASARTFWHEFLPVNSGEEYKFGTLVFFNNLQHVGIVADENGFYHASRSNGVTYSPFNKYWASRVDGFRRVPVPQVAAAE